MDVLEKVAKAFYEGPPPDGRSENEPRFQKHPWNNLYPHLREMHIEKTKAALAVLSENVSDEMVEAACRADWNGNSIDRNDWETEGEPFKAEYRRRMRLGIAAALLVLKDQPR